MKSRITVFRRVCFYVVAGILNVGSLVLLWQVIGLSPPQAAAIALPEPVYIPETITVTFGKPVRVVVPRLGIDLKVDEGYYNPADASWTLSDNNAHFAMPTSLANDYNGNTLIYGHNSEHVFGRMKNIAPGDTVEVYTDNGHIFHYVYATSQKVIPEDTSIFQYQGPPIVTIQTCSGNWNEVRSLSTFNFQRVTKKQPEVETEEARKARLMNNIRRLTAPDTDKPVSRVLEDV